MRIDLHIHTNASDGQLAPAALIDEARKGELDLIAITDHDTVAGVQEAITAASELHPASETVQQSPQQLRVLPGIEISTNHNGVELHILGYGIDHNHPEIIDYTRRARDRRVERIHGMIGLLANYGIEVHMDDVIAAAGGSDTTLGRPHLARAMVGRGAIATVNEAFDRFIGDDGPAFLPTDLLTTYEAIELIDRMRGWSIWAHPPIELLEITQELVDHGLQGLECFRPRNTNSATQRLLHTAAEYELLITGGSDWHGEWNGPLGSFAVDRVQVGEFLEELELGAG